MENFSEFLKIVALIKPDEHIMAGRRSCEANVKIKLVLPLLEFLGYSIIEDAYFELRSAAGSIDIAIVDIVDEDSKPRFIIETKSWKKNITNDLDQSLEYTLALCTPYVMVTSGEHTALYSSLLNSNDLRGTKPIIEFRFNDLKNKDGRNILSKLYSLLSKESLLNGAQELNKVVMELLPKGQDISRAKKNFERKCEKFKPSYKLSYRITDKDFRKRANRHSKQVYDALILGLAKFHKIAKENKKIGVRYRSKNIGLEYSSSRGPREKTLGLADINPESARIAFGMEDWRELISSPEIIKQLEEFPRAVKDEQQIKNLVSLLLKAIKELPAVE